ncbi:monovalent cation/H+ antiporter complex subunit F [Actinomycetospora lemnae]|uniref:Monovalent cation/H+ antiporter complex subunit F n=1 Tax=Actinomycetospora lemnae TaxID=3019891 RepID=A0ABT5T275_9PSEU|nr:monovalent cation/H+ antiporter complex subunit F [Actinomycetospora sp. DW7H6]MDD7968043.1 monovalent cation/H+ antiporter complex subunit F [Actinomycetospora sp. DW7H6]
MSGVPLLVVVAALVWVTVLVIVGVLALLRGRDVLQRLIALDLLAVLVVALLALLSYLRDVPHYLDAAVALTLLSFVATVAAARYLATGGPLE